MPLPPSFPGPAALQIVRWLREPFPMLEDSRTRFGEAFTMRLPGRAPPVVIVSNPDVVKEVFALGPDEGHAGKANIVLKPFLGKHSLLLLDGAEHLRQRKMMLPAFHGERMHAYGRTMLDAADDAIDRFPVGQRFAVHRPMQAITLEIIIRTVFGIAGPHFKELGDALTRALDMGTWPILLFPFMQRDFGRYSPWGRYQHFAGRASEILRAEIRRGRASGGTEGRTDVLAMILAARDEGGALLSEDEVHDELVTLLIAGHETTATALAWTLHGLLPQRDLVRRLREEIATAGGDPLRIAKLELLDGTVKEALRLQPVIPLVGRVLQEDMRLGSLDLPAGTVVAPSIYLMHRRASLYPEPARFHPERFRGFKPAPWEWLPFGGGLRRCIGAAFAIYEMKMVLAALLTRTDLRLSAPPEATRVVRRGITLTPSEGLPVTVLLRKPRERHASAA